jgi:proline iminopeptidase
MIGLDQLAPGMGPRAVSAIERSSAAGHLRAVGLAALSLGLLDCSEHRTPPPEQAATATASVAAAAVALPPGEAYLDVPDGRIWYKVTANGSGLPLIMLHGGPGFSSYYLKPFEALGDDRPVVRYDQLGGGKSGPLSDTTLFTIPHFVRELDSLRAHLGYGRVHLLGHSWGTILAVEYYRAHPDHVASLVLASAALDIPAWERHARSLISTLDDSAQHAIRSREAEGRFDAPDYQAALAKFYSLYVWRHPVQADLDSTLATVDQAIYNYMQGPSEFTITGTLKRYDAKPFLKRVKVPVLYTVGEFDEANPPTIRAFAALTPGAMVAVLPGAAHMTPWDAPRENVQVVRDFLRGADSAAGNR